MPASYDVDGPGPSSQGAGLLMAIRRHPFIVVAAVIIAALLGALITLVLPTKYTATAQVVLGDPNDATVFRTVPILNATAKAQNATQIMRSQAVYDRASVILDHKLSASDVSDSVDVTPGAEGNPLVTISATRGSGKSARDVANAEGQAYLDVTKSQAAARAVRAKQALKQPQQSLQNQLDSLNRQSLARAATIQKKSSSIVKPADRANYVASVLASDPQYQSLRNQETELTTNIAAISQTIQESQVDASLSESGVDTLYAASTPSNPQPSSLKRNIVVAAALGLLIGAALAWRRLERSRGMDQAVAASALGAPVLATVKESRELSSPTQVIDLAFGSPLADDLRVLASSLLLNLRRLELTGCLITSAERGVGKTVLSLNLAAAAESAGHDVVLVPAADSHREPSSTELPHLRRPDGTVPTAIVDTPAVSTDPLALVLGSGPLGIVVIVSHSSTLDDLRTLRSRADLVGAHILGFVVNEHRPSATSSRRSTQQQRDESVDTTGGHAAVPAR